MIYFRETSIIRSSSIRNVIDLFRATNAGLGLDIASSLSNSACAATIGRT